MAFSKLDALASVAELMGGKDDKSRCEADLPKTRRRTVNRNGEAGGWTSQGERRTAYGTDRIEATTQDGCVSPPIELTEAATVASRSTFGIAQHAVLPRSFPQTASDAVQRDRAGFSEPGATASTQNLSSAPSKRSPPVSGGFTTPNTQDSWALPAAKRRSAISAGGQLLTSAVAGHQPYDTGIQQSPTQLGAMGDVLMDEMYDAYHSHPARPQPQPQGDTIAKLVASSRNTLGGAPPRWSTSVCAAPPAAAGTVGASAAAPGAPGSGPPSSRLRGSGGGRFSPGVSAASDEPCTTTSSHHHAAFLGRTNRVSNGSLPLGPLVSSQPAHPHQHPYDAAAAPLSLPLPPQPVALLSMAVRRDGEPGAGYGSLSPGAAPTTTTSPAGSSGAAACRQHGGAAIASPAPYAEAAAAAPATVTTATASPDVVVGSDAVACLSAMAQSPTKGGPDLLEKMRIAETLLTHRDKLGPQLVQLVIQQLAALCQSASMEDLVARMAAKEAAAAAPRPQGPTKPDPAGSDASADISRSNSGSHTRDLRGPVPEPAATATTGPCGPDLAPAPLAEVVGGQLAARAPVRGAGAGARAEDGEGDGEGEHGRSTSSSSSSSRTATHSSEPRATAAAAATGSTLTGPSARPQAAAAANGQRAGGCAQNRGAGRRGSGAAAAATAVSLDTPACPEQASQSPCAAELASAQPPPAPSAIPPTVVAATGRRADAPADAPAPRMYVSVAAAAPVSESGSGLLLRGEGPLGPSSLLPRHLQQQQQQQKRYQVLRSVQPQQQMLQQQMIQQQQQQQLYRQPSLGLPGNEWGDVRAEADTELVYAASTAAPAAALARRQPPALTDARPAPQPPDPAMIMQHQELRQVELGRVGRKVEFLEGPKAGQVPVPVPVPLSPVLDLAAGPASATTAALIAALAQRAKSIADMRPAEVEGLAAVLAQQQQGVPFLGQLRAAAAASGGAPPAPPPPQQQQPVLLRRRQGPASEGRGGGCGAGGKGVYEMGMEWEAARQGVAGTGMEAAAPLPPQHLQLQQQYTLHQQSVPCMSTGVVSNSAGTQVARRALAAALAAKVAAAVGGPGGGGGVAWNSGDGEACAADTLPLGPVTAASAATAWSQWAVPTAMAPSSQARLVARGRDAVGPGPGWSAAAAAARGLGDAHRCNGGGGSGGGGHSLSPDAYVTIRLSEPLPAGAAAAKAISPAAYGMT